MSAIGENIARIRAEIDAAARETGRTGKDITLVGASKMNDAAACQEAIAAGIDALGENRVQEMTEKLKENAYDGAPLHFIGHLQRNKVKQVVGKAALIQSVGSKELLDEIEKVAARMELVQDVLLEANIGGEEAKSGFAPEEAEMDIRLSQPLLMDGATATNLLLRGMLQYSCPAEWMLENPEPVRQLHREFLQAGSRIICTPTARANAVMLEEWNQQDRMEQYNERLAQMTVET